MGETHMGESQSNPQNNSEGNLRVTGGPATVHEVLEEIGSGQWGQDRLR